jgi:hypothetical protein
MKLLLKFICQLIGRRPLSKPNKTGCDRNLAEADGLFLVYHFLAIMSRNLHFATKDLSPWLELPSHADFKKNENSAHTAAKFSFFKMKFVFKLTPIVPG